MTGRTKVGIKSEILNLLFNRQATCTLTEMKNLITENRVILNLFHERITYLDQVIDESSSVKSWAPKIPLHESLHPKMDALLEEKRLLEEQHDKVDAFISAALTMCWSIADIYTAIPESLHGCLPSISCKSETSNTIKEEVFAFNQANQEVLDIISERLLINTLLH